MPEGLVQWEITLPQLLGQQGYATGMWGKWHLGSDDARLPTNRGFDEWFGIPRTYDEAEWPSSNETSSMWPSVGKVQGWNGKIAPQEPIYDNRKGEKPRVIGLLDVDNRRTMEAEITKRAVDFIKRNASSGKPFFAYVSFSLVHHRGPEKFIAEALTAGLSGLIVPDLPVEEAGPLIQLAAAHDFKLIQLVTPTTPRDRARRIAQTSTGFLYCVSVTGITGERDRLPDELLEQLRWLRGETDLP